MGNHKYKILCSKKKTPGQKMMGWVLRHPRFIILGVMIVMFIITLMILKVSARPDYLLPYGSG